jgi:Rps23 Pro-64 3,4-dihydroxylase Tpa1-like proline 4-hydroxylase
MALSDSQIAMSSDSVSGIDAHQLVREGMINPQLDLPALADRFATEGILQIEQALRPQVADLLHDCLATQVPWALAFRDPSGPRKLWAEELAAMDAAGRGALDEEIYRIAREEFQFRYDNFMMVTAYKEKRHPELLLHRVIEQINSSPWIEAFRTITGLKQIRRADAQATRYVAGHFLRRHNDMNEDDGRLCAYVINLSRGWQADWGGLLQFLDHEGDVVRTLMPRFNTISLFRVPADHCVSPVAPFATGARYAITGWLRS